MHDADGVADNVGVALLALWSLGHSQIMARAATPWLDHVGDSRHAHHKRVQHRRGDCEDGERQDPKVQRVFQNCIATLVDGTAPDIADMVRRF